MITPFERTVNYYETDRMGIVHHSNYIRFFEESRNYYMSEYGLPYEVIEEAGILIPVLSVEAQYKKPFRFGETMVITEWMTQFSQVKFQVKYEVRNKETKELHVVGTSEHCFVDEQLKPVRLKKDYPNIYQVFANIYDIDTKLWNQSHTLTQSE